MIICNCRVREVIPEKPYFPHFQISVEKFPFYQLQTLFTYGNFLFLASIYFLHLQIEKTGQD